MTCLVKCRQCKNGNHTKCSGFEKPDVLPDGTVLDGGQESCTCCGGLSFEQRKAKEGKNETERMIN